MQMCMYISFKAAYFMIVIHPNAVPGRIQSLSSRNLDVNLKRPYYHILNATSEEAASIQALKP